jgi:hypothetical protein
MPPANERANPASEADMVGVVTAIRPVTPTIVADSMSKRVESHRLTIYKIAVINDFNTDGYYIIIHTTPLPKSGIRILPSIRSSESEIL